MTHHCTCRLDRHIGILRSNFALVGEVKEEEEGEEGEEEEEEEKEGEGDGKLIKESDDVFSVWASGRINCENFLAQIKVYTYLQCRQNAVCYNFCKN